MLVYELPAPARKKKPGRGQVQYWFLLELSGESALARPENNPEVRALEWMPFPTLLDRTVDFRKPLYRKLGQQFHLAG